MARNRDSLEGAVMDYLNTTRGQALEAVFHGLNARDDIETQWVWIEKMATQSIVALRVGAVEHLLPICHLDPERALKVFADLCKGNAEVLRSFYAHRFLYWIIYHYPDETLPLIRQLMDDPSENMAQEGAQIACVLALRSNNINTELLSELISGPPTWRRGVAEITTNSVTSNLSQDVLDECINLLSRCFYDEDDEVIRSAVMFTASLSDEHLETLKSLIESYVRSPAYADGSHWLNEFLLKYGDLEPEWTLQQIETILQRAKGGESVLHGLGGDELARCILHLYNLPERRRNNDFRSHCMDAFGELLELSPHEAQSSLRDWDEGRYS